MKSFTNNYRSQDRFFAFQNKDVPVFALFSAVVWEISTTFIKCFFFIYWNDHAIG